MKYKTIVKEIKSGIAIAVATYCLFGNCYGVAEQLLDNTTGHVSSDIYLGKHTPTTLERVIVKKGNNLVSKILE